MSSDTSDWDDNPEEYNRLRSVDSLPVIPMVRSALPKSISLSENLEKNVSKPLQHWENLPSSKGKYTTAVSLLDVPWQALSQTASQRLASAVHQDNVSHEIRPRKKSAYPPLPSNFSNMNKRDKEAVLRLYSEIDLEPSENEDYTPETSVDGSVIKLEIYSSILRQKYDSVYQHPLNQMSMPPKLESSDANSITLSSDTMFQTPSVKVSYMHLPSTPVNEREEKTIFFEDLSKLKAASAKGPASPKSWAFYADTERKEQPDKKWRKSFAATTISRRKKQKDFEFVRMEQIIGGHKGEIWTMKFNSDGRFLATGGKDGVVRVWTVVGSSNDSMRWKSKQNELTRRHTFSGFRNTPHEQKPPDGCIINPIPYREYRGHKADVVDIDWAKRSDLLLSASMDSTVMLWRVSKDKCLCMFQHADYVTSVRFHPLNSAYFVSASFDSRIRLWKIPDRRVVAWNQLETLVTAVAFSQDGGFIVAGLYNGHCVFFNVDMDSFQLNWYNKLECWDGKRSGKKITSIQYWHNQKTGDGSLNDGCAQCLVTTNDSRIRLYTIKNYKISLTAKYKGFKNNELQIAATFSDDGKYVIAGSEDGGIYIWNKEIRNNSFMSLKKNLHSKTNAYEMIRPPSRKKLTTNVAIFAPPRTVKYVSRERDNELNDLLGMPDMKNIVLSADQEGMINVFVNYESIPGGEYRSTGFWGEIADRVV